jgi:hypothetical protein
LHTLLKIRFSIALPYLIVLAPFQPIRPSTVSNWFPSLSIVQAPSAQTKMTENKNRETIKKEISYKSIFITFAS